MIETRECGEAQQVLEDLHALRKRLNGLTMESSVGVDEAALIDVISDLEDLKSCAAAAQAHAAAELSRRREATAVGTRGLASEIALARRESPHKGSRLLGVATANEMPHTYAALQAGQISEWRATIVVRETAVLSKDGRIEVDRQLAPVLSQLGDRRLGDKARKIAYALDAGAVLRRQSHAHSERRVSIRPAPDTMSYLTGFLPAAQGVACFASLSKEADTLRAAGDERGRGQIMADLFVQRLTGQAAPEAIPQVALNVTMSAETLFNDSEEPGYLEGYGPIPAFIVRNIARDSDRVWLRRLFTRPATDELVAMESKSRCFTGQLRRFIILRDQVCRTPWCDAPIRHIDHIVAWIKGGPTAASNAHGLCVRCNLNKETPGWRSDRPPGYETWSQATTPTGHNYRIDYQPSAA